jgi:hypothetical protein
MHRKLLKTALAAQQAPVPVGHLTLGEDALIPVALLSAIHRYCWSHE